jgi:hypothetical protein
MKVSDLLAKKNAKVSVRVPVAMQDQTGLKSVVSGRVESVRSAGRIARVLVLVRGKSYEFRPQDLTLVASPSSR